MRKRKNEYGNQKYVDKVVKFKMSIKSQFKEVVKELINKERKRLKEFDNYNNDYIESEILLYKKYLKGIIDEI